MKNYKFLVPILLVVMFVGSIYMLYDLKATEQERYNTTLAAARDFREKDIQIDAEDCYMQALNHKPSIDLYVEIGEFYWETQQVKKATNWGATIIKTYPEEIKGYEFLMGIYDKREDYIACFDLYETVEKRQLESVVIDDIIDRIEFTFYFNGEYHGAGIYSGGLSPIEIDHKWGYVNQTGDKVINALYTYAGPFIEGLAPVTDAEGNAYYIDTEGNKKHVVLGVENIKQLGLLENGMFSLYDGEMWHFYNTDHEKVFGDYDEVSAIGNGVAAVKSNGQWKLVDRTGADLTGKTYASVAMDEKLVVFRNDRLFVSDGIKYQMITSSGEVVGSGSYEDVRIFNDSTYAAVKINGKWGYIDKDGTVKIEPQYEDARSFANGMAAVMQDGLWGFINADGEMVIEPQFEDARDFNSNGCVFIFSDSEWKLLRLYKTNH